MVRHYMVAVILAVGVLAVTACGEFETPNKIDTCDDLVPLVIKLSEDSDNPFVAKILKISEVTEGTASGEITLQCNGQARWSSGGDDPIDFYILEDADGDRFYGFKRQ